MRQIRDNGARSGQKTALSAKKYEILSKRQGGLTTSSFVWELFIAQAEGKSQLILKIHAAQGIFRDKGRKIFGSFHKISRIFL